MKLIALLCCLLCSCSTMTLDCPSDHVVTATLNGPNISTIASQLVSILGPLLAGGTLAARPELPASSSDGTLTVKTLDIVGVQTYSCGNAAAVIPASKIAAPAPSPPPVIESPMAIPPQNLRMTIE